MRILVDGKDARTDAMAAACAKSVHAPELFALSQFNHPGLAEKCQELEIVESLTSRSDTARYARKILPDLAIIGPEDPLAAGIVDELLELGIPCFGPTAALAKIESSKSWTRRLVAKYGIAGNPRFRFFESADGLASELAELGEFVVKPDGLTGGKGVRVHPEHFDDFDEALGYAQECIANDGAVLIEERLDGEEFSLQTITDGESFIHCPIVQDHKRSREGDAGPNTGGMGSYSCPDHSLPFLSAQDVASARLINEQVVAALHTETGTPYRGVLYGGFIATSNGVQLIEYNARFADPESLNVLAILASDFVDIAFGAATGNLRDVNSSFEAKATVCKYVVPSGYPEAAGSGEVIRIPSEWLGRHDVRFFWAATELDGAEIKMTGSRALGVVGIGSTLAEAENVAEQAVNAVEGPVRHRRDIGTAELVAKRVAHMERIRGEAPH